MKTLSEVCKIVGVTRRTLQEYDKIGLLHPTGKTASGYWLYDDYAIKALMFIQIFVECGYQRNEIKELLNGEEKDIIDAFNGLVGKLEDKKKRIDGMINTIKVFQIAANLPFNTLEALQKVDPANAFKEDSFRSCLEKSILNESEIGEPDDEAQRYLSFWYSLVSIGCNKDMPCDSSEVTDCVETLMTNMLQYAPDKDIQDIDKADIIECLYEVLEEVLSDEQFNHMLELQCGVDSREYILEAIKMYGKKFKQEER